MANQTNCYVCGKQPVDDHHIDCKHGEVSDETVPLCRRCHRTYHDLGVEWFEEEYLDKILEIENKRRALYPNLYHTTTTRAVPHVPLDTKLKLDRSDIIRSDYWNKTHGIKKAKPNQANTAIESELPGSTLQLPLFS